MMKIVNSKWGNRILFGFLSILLLLFLIIGFVIRWVSAPMELSDDQIRMVEEEQRKVAAAQAKRFKTHGDTRNTTSSVEKTTFGNVTKADRSIATEGDAKTSTVSELSSEAKALLSQAPKGDDFYNQQRKLLEELLKIEQREGRKNAMIHYIKASWLAPKVSNPRFNEWNMLNMALDGSTTACEALLPWIERWKPALDEIRKGAALDYSQFIAPVSWDTPVPNFLTAQTATKVLCAQGRDFESQGQFDQAIDNYLVALTMGRDYGGPGNTLIGNLIDIANENISLKSLCQLIDKEQLSKVQLEKIMGRLNEILPTKTSSLDIMAGESVCTMSTIKQIMDGTIDFDKLTGHSRKRINLELLLFDDRARSEYVESIYQRIYIRWRIDEAIPSLNKIVDLRKSILQEPYGSEKRAQLERNMLEFNRNSPPVTRMAIPNFTEAECRSDVCLTRFHSVRLKSAVGLWKRERGRYPDTLDSVYGKWFDSKPVVDPFSHKEFNYRSAGDGESYEMWSVGPDGKSDGATFSYDPSNGTLSAGDVF